MSHETIYRSLFIQTRGVLKKELLDHASGPGGPSAARDTRNSHVATQVQRHSRYLMLVEVAHEDAESVFTALIKQSKKLPGELYQSLI